MALSPEPPTCSCPTTTPKIFTATTTSKAAGKTKQEALDEARKVADKENDIELSRIVCEGDQCELKTDIDPNVDVGTPTYEEIKDGKDKVVGYRCQCTRSEAGKFSCKQKSGAASGGSFLAAIDLEELCVDTPESDEVIAYSSSGATSLRVRAGKKKVVTKALASVREKGKS